MTDLAAAPVSADECARIAAIRNRVIRNLEITECYSRLSDAIRERTGETANWCTFATWASRQAGSTIRGEDMIDRLERRLRGRARLMAPVQSFNRWLLRKGLFEPNTALGRLVSEVHTPFDAFERASDAVARGNLKVFDEIGREFARFLAAVPADAQPDSPEFTAFASTLRPGPPPEGQDLLLSAFRRYQQQRHVADDHARAAMILLANLEIGLHEQTRLQPQIAEAIDAPLVTARDLGIRVLHRLVPWSRRWPAVVLRPAVSIVGSAAAWIRRAAIQVTREVITESLMVLALPHAVLALGRDLDAPVPAVLTRTADAELVAFLREHDPCAPGQATCGARNWCDLAQRMHYIVHLFRAYAVDPALFSRPFTPQQAATFREGRVPSADL